MEVETQALLAHEAKVLAEKERDEALTVKEQLIEELNHKLCQYPSCYEKRV